MDEADLAEHQEQMHRDRAMAMRKPVLVRPADGTCFNCREFVKPGVRFCDRDCRDDWELRNGRP